MTTVICGHGNLKKTRRCTHYMYNMASHCSVCNLEVTDDGKHDAYDGQLVTPFYGVMSWPCDEFTGSHLSLYDVARGTNQLVTQSTRHTVKWRDELTIVSDGVVTSWPYFWPSIRHIQELCRRWWWRDRVTSWLVAGRPSVCHVCNAHASYSAGCNLSQCLYAIW